MRSYIRFHFSSVTLLNTLLFQPVLLQKLKYAIHFCKSIDKDEYARVAMAGDLAVSSSSDAESDPEMDSSN